MTERNKVTTICISPETWKLIKDDKRLGETMEDVVRRWHRKQGGPPK